MVLGLMLVFVLVLGSGVGLGVVGRCDGRCVWELGVGRGGDLRGVRREWYVGEVLRGRDRERVGRWWRGGRLRGGGGGLLVALLLWFGLGWEGGI